MNYTKLTKFSKECIRHWTTTAKQCYLLGGMCKKCTALPADLKEKCLMKYAIVLLTKKLGKPFERKNNILYCTPCRKKKNSVK